MDSGLVFFLVALAYLVGRVTEAWDQELRRRRDPAPVRFRVVGIPPMSERTERAKQGAGR